MPPKRKTPMHCFPISDELWDAAKANAAAQGEVWTHRLQAFVKREARRKPPPGNGEQP